MRYGFVELLRGGTLVLDERYQIVPMIGRGSVGTVYRAEQRAIRIALQIWVAQGDA